MILGLGVFGSLLFTCIFVRVKECEWFTIRSE